MERQQKKVPLRKCIITKEKLPKSELIRVVRTPEGTVELDITGKKNGRGAYIQKQEKAIQKARKSNMLARHLDTIIPEELYVELMELIKNEPRDT